MVTRHVSGGMIAARRLLAEVPAKVHRFGWKTWQQLCLTGQNRAGVTLGKAPSSVPSWLASAMANGAEMKTTCTAVRAVNSTMKADPTNIFADGLENLSERACFGSK